MWWAGQARREFEGELVAVLARTIPAAVWQPAELFRADLNPFRGPAAESEAMRKHRAAWAARRFRVLAGG